MSGAAITNAARRESENTTTHPDIDALLSTMAAPTTGWPSAGGQPVSAAPHDPMYNNGFLCQYGSPLSDLYEAPDETDDWAVLMQQDMLATGDYPAAGDFFSPNMIGTEYPQPSSSPEDIFNDPLVLYDVEQSLQADLFALSGPLPDLSASGYLSGDQLSASSYFGSANTSPFEASMDYLPEVAAPTYSSADASPSSSSPDGSADFPHRCTTDGCIKTFRKEAQLKQHQRVHRKALVCPICKAEHRTEHKFAQVRDLERHLQARHRDVAERANVRSEVRECPHPGCEHRGRRDNVSRHHESKHGKKLKWKRGVPHVVD
ncbi:zinc finger protein 76 (expressed in testis) [Colletotrichum plurivorum]|uniref:Zinc finger protein 76 (Expressed in testis) n=1 Tax=Colletotrichum plurivorum TaxID=2175906 RepID=A0A8H6KLG5_9PEZI|nr:zinc finger protein 76 (expressed in testis) [Colletotrichum plurivorum]